MSRFWFNPMFWLVTVIVAWLVLITLSIADNPEGARAHSMQAPQSELLTR
ncbi:hypothetical protein [Actinosynnema sp. ALI-1.44]|nr:hypothetical protein [Actinosynnema sp. ALI-1.44]